MSLEIVPCSIIDCVVLSRLHNLCFSLDWTASEFKKLLSMPGAFARFIWDTDNPGLNYAGFVLARIAREEAEIITIGVVPNCRGQGFGAKLVCAVVVQCRAKGALELLLEVAETNELAIRLYKSLSFQIVGRRIGYYGDQVTSNDDAIIMRRILT